MTMVPGVDTALVLRTAVVHGRGAAYAAVAGISTGLLVWAAAAAVGVSALLAACNPTARLRCSSNSGGTCMSTGTGAAGSTCVRGDLSFFTCDPGLVCRTNAGGAPTCQRPGAVGEDCDNDGDCVSGSCDNLANRCAARACE